MMGTETRSSKTKRRRCFMARTSGLIKCNVDEVLAVSAVVLVLMATYSATVYGFSPAASVARNSGPPPGTVPPQAVATNGPRSMTIRSSSLFSTTVQKAEEIASRSDDKNNSNSSISSSVQKRLREQKQRKPPTIITCSSTKELVHAVNSVVTRDHVVAELGSQLREVSNAIRNKSSSDSVYVDVKRNFPKQQQTNNAANPQKEQKRISSMRLATSGDDTTGGNTDTNEDGAATHVDFDFREIDKFSDWRSAFFQSSSVSSNRYDVLVLDVNAIVGNDLEWTCLDLVLEFEQMAAMVAAEVVKEHSSEETSPNSSSDDSYHGLQYVLVKSLGLNSVASQLTYTVPWLDPNKTNHNRLCRIVATVGVHDYRRTIPGVLKLLQESHLKSKPPSDSETEEASEATNFFVVEVGCHFGTSTVLLNNIFDHVMGVDVGSKIIKEAQKKYPDVFFRAGDAWKTAGLLRLQQEYYAEKEESGGTDGSISKKKIGFDAVYVDVGGLSGADGLLDTIALVKSIQYALEPECIVVKSLCLQRLASRFTPYWKWQKKGENELN